MLKQETTIFIADDDGTALETTDLQLHQIDKRLIKLEEVIFEVKTSFY